MIAGLGTFELEAEEQLEETTGEGGGKETGREELVVVGGDKE